MKKGLIFGACVALAVAALYAVQPPAEAPAPVAPDTAALALLVVQSHPTVEDSTVACLLYRTGDYSIGLVAPALVARRTTPDSIKITYEDDVTARCAELVQSRGYTLSAPARTDIDVTWDYEKGSHALGRRKPFIGSKA